jgi:hypothetical protein
MKPKYKPGDKVKVTLELEVFSLSKIKNNVWYHFGNVSCEVKSTDKIAKLVKKPARKKVKG